MLAINFLEPERRLEASNSVLGEILIDDETERFAADLSIWNKGNYISHWSAAMQRVQSKKLFTMVCCSRGKISSEFWIVVPRYNQFVVYNSIIKDSDLVFFGSSINTVDHETFYRNMVHGEMSEWTLQSVGF